MAKLKLGALEDDKPVKVTLELPAAVHRNLLAYAEVLSQETGRPVIWMKTVAARVGFGNGSVHRQAVRRRRSLRVDRHRTSMDVSPALSVS